MLYFTFGLLCVFVPLGSNDMILILYQLLQLVDRPIFNSCIFDTHLEYTDPTQCQISYLDSDKGS